MRVNRRKARYIFKKRRAQLEIIYSPLSGGGRRGRRGLSLTASCLTGRRSIGGRPWGSELGLAGSGAHTKASTGGRSKRAL